MMMSLGGCGGNDSLFRINAVGRPALAVGECMVRSNALGDGPNERPGASHVRHFSVNAYSCASLCFRSVLV